MAAQVPVVLCEGETDNVYLTHAIQSLAVEFPDLAEVMPDKKIRLKVRLYKHPRSSTARLLGLKSGGNGALSTFIKAYKKETRRFTGPGLTNPVVILYDNDKGAKCILDAIKDVSKVLPTGAEPFVHVIKNMYAVPTPGAPSKIEDLFDATIKATMVNGKTFNDRKNLERDKHYGKKIFRAQGRSAKGWNARLHGFSARSSPTSLRPSTSTRRRSFRNGPDPEATLDFRCIVGTEGERPLAGPALRIFPIATSPRS